MASSGPGLVMGFGGGPQRGSGSLPMKIDSMGVATMPLGRVTRDLHPPAHPPWETVRI